MDKLQTTIRDGVLFMEISNPPVNALSQAVRAALLAAVQRLGAEPGLRGGVILGTGNVFVAGADIKEFGLPPAPPLLPDVLASIESCPKPIVAALHGAVLGGGLELALACDTRIALANTQLGLPEVTLGLIPGAGGTQRLPRLTGIATAIRLICGGERLKANEALKLGILDKVVADDLQITPLAWLNSTAAGKHPVSKLTVPHEMTDDISRAEQTALKTGKFRPAVIAAIAAVKESASVPFTEALAHEHAAFQKLRSSPEAAALRHMFFAEREATRLPAGVPQTPRAINIVAVIGAGTMGGGIARTALEAGYTVILLDQNTKLLSQTGEKLRAKLPQARLTLADGWAGIASADLIIEAVFEDLSVKQDVFRKLDSHAKPGAILATNTSYLDIDKIASASKRPEEVLGLHFFSPVHAMKLLEVVRGTHSAPDLAATGMAFAKSLKKIPVLCGNGFGFIGNRIYNAYRTQCEFMLEDGAWPEDVDAALEAFGFAMGPFNVADLSGLDIAWRMRKARAATRDPRTRYVPVLDELCARGRFGHKTGAGYYNYADGKRSSGSDDLVRSIIAEASARRGITRHALTPETIQRRALIAMVNEAAQLLAEGIAQRASDIDVVLVHGYGFPRWVGGPVHWARMQPRERLEQDLDSIAAATGFGFSRGNLDILLNKTSEDNAP